jgi:ribosome assembly protein RRB1
MGKKSKRVSSGQTNPKKISERKNDNRILLDETPENLRFEDPFEDEFEPEEIADGEEQNIQQDSGEVQQSIKAWNPLTSTLDPNTKLEVDESAYKMHHSLTPEWPALSFDIIRDNLGESRTRFPHSMIVAAGTQADRADRNKLTIMKLSDLCRTGAKEKTEKELEDEILGEEYDREGNDSDDSENEDDEVEDMDPVLEHFSLKHMGGVNRIRAMPQKPEIVATWSEIGNVNMYNIGGILDSFERSAGQEVKSSRKIIRDPFFVYQGHKCEGYAMDWSRVREGQFATGDCSGNIHVWATGEGYSNLNTSSFKVTPSYSACGVNIDNPSVEDIQWSPTEATVFATAECGGIVKIYDTRCAGRAMLTNKIHENGSDVNVISWNPIISNLLASGGDDGLFSVWDLRNFQSVDTPPQPLARFTCHKKPITSLEWHPSDESMIVVTDEDATYIYDLSIEEDEEEDGKADLEDSIPPQLLFVHCGSESTKEAHWHPQITSCVFTTSLSGYSTFIPSNL